MQMVVLWTPRQRPLVFEKIRWLNAETFGNLLDSREMRFVFVAFYPPEVVPREPD